MSSSAPWASTSDPALTRASSPAAAPRTVEVAAARLSRWVAGFAEQHGGVGDVPATGGLVLAARDGATATLTHPWGDPDAAAAAGDPDAAVAAFAAAVTSARRVAVLLVRRGGYAVAVVDPSGGGAVLVSKTGTRRVQGRTAAGGWSQQRFARRREKQTGELAGAAADVGARLLLDPPATDLATGGDRALVERVLADPRLRPLAALPRGPYLPVGDPKPDVVRALPALLTSVSVKVTAGSSS